MHAHQTCNICTVENVGGLRNISVLKIVGSLRKISALENVGGLKNKCFRKCWQFKMLALKNIGALKCKRNPPSTKQTFTSTKKFRSLTG
jgi:hypothetical protein